MTDSDRDGMAISLDVSLASGEPPVSRNANANANSLTTSTSGSRRTATVYRTLGTSPTWQQAGRKEQLEAPWLGIDGVGAIGAMRAALGSRPLEFGFREITIQGK